MKRTSVIRQRTRILGSLGILRTEINNAPQNEGDTDPEFCKWLNHYLIWPIEHYLKLQSESGELFNSKEEPFNELYTLYTSARTLRDTLTKDTPQPTSPKYHPASNTSIYALLLYPEAFEMSNPAGSATADLGFEGQLSNPDGIRKRHPNKSADLPPNAASD